MYRVLLNSRAMSAITLCFSDAVLAVLWNSILRSLSEEFFTGVAYKVAIVCLIALLLPVVTVSFSRQTLYHIRVIRPLAPDAVMLPYWCRPE